MHLILYRELMGNEKINKVENYSFCDGINIRKHDTVNNYKYKDNK